MVAAARSPAAAGSVQYWRASACSAWARLAQKGAAWATHGAVAGHRRHGGACVRLGGAGCSSPVRAQAFAAAEIESNTWLARPQFTSGGNKGGKQLSRGRGRCLHAAARLLSAHEAAMRAAGGKAPMQRLATHRQARSRPTWAVLGMVVGEVTAASMAWPRNCCAWPWEVCAGQGGGPPPPPEGFDAHSCGVKHACGAVYLLCEFPRDAFMVGSGRALRLQAAHAVRCQAKRPTPPVRLHLGPLSTPAPPSLPLLTLPAVYARDVNIAGHRGHGLPARARAREAVAQRALGEAPALAQACVQGTAGAGWGSAALLPSFHSNGKQEGLQL